jgi:hypothetical protein
MLSKPTYFIFDLDRLIIGEFKVILGIMLQDFGDDAVSKLLEEVLSLVLCWGVVLVVEVSVELGGVIKL